MQLSIFKDQNTLKKYCDIGHVIDLDVDLCQPVALLVVFRPSKGGGGTCSLVPLK